MTRFLTLLIAATLTAAPGFAAGFTFDLPQLTFPAPKEPVTQSTSGTPQPAPPQSAATQH